MKKLSAGLMMLVLASATLWAQEKKESAAPPQDREDPQKKMVKKLAKEVRASLVGIEILFKKKTPLELAMEREEPEAYDEEMLKITQARESRIPLKTFGVVLDKEGTLLMPSLAAPVSDIEKITVVDSDGAKWSAEPLAILQNFDATLLKIKEQKEKSKNAKWTPIRFSSAPISADKTFPLGAYYYTVFLENVDEVWHANVTPYIVTNVEQRAENQEQKKEGTLFLIDQIKRGAVVADEEGNILGIALDTFLWVNGHGRSSFIGEDIVKDKRITFAELKEQTEQFEKRLLQHVVKVEVRFREEKGDVERTRSGDGEGAAKLTLFGVPINDKGQILLPYALDREGVKKIESLEIRDESLEKKTEARFVGLFKDFGAMLIQADPKAVSFEVGLFNWDVKDWVRGELWFSVSLDKKFGRTKIDINPNRVFRREQGIKGVVAFTPRRRVKPGSWALSQDGKLVALFTVDKKEEDIEESAREVAMRRYMMARSGRESDIGTTRLFLVSELKAKLEQPNGYFDTKATPVTKKEEGKRMWLGVEFQSVGAALAKELKVEKQTKDGKQGLLVTAIYPRSPAEKLGLKIGDILLGLKVEGQDHEPARREIELTLEGASDSSYDEYYRYYSFRGSFRVRGDEAPTAPWKSRKNYLTTLLTEIGEGRKVTLKYARGQEEKPVELTLETAPVDFEHAEKYKDEEIGLTVKELTYEARNFQKMDKDASGVVVAKVESGGKAEVGKLMPFMTIQKVNGIPVKGLSHFQELINGFKKSDARSVTLEVLQYGQTRFVDIAK